jgi:hypothetical protein
LLKFNKAKKYCILTTHNGKFLQGLPPMEMYREGRNSQNFLGKFVRFFVTLGLKILIFFRLKVLFEADFIKKCVNYCINHRVPIFYE